MLKALQAEYKILAHIYDQKWAFYNNATVKQAMAYVRKLPVPFAIDNVSNAKILDLGCGTGLLTQRLLEYFPTAQILGIDLSSAMLEIAQQKLSSYQPRLTLEQKNAMDLDYPSQSFDLIICSSVWHYFTAPDIVLNHIYRLLKPQGYLIINDWCRDYFTCYLLDQYLHLTKRPHYHTYTQTELHRLLTNHQFMVQDAMTYKINWFWGMMVTVATKS